VRLATGSPVPMNSVTAAYSTERARLGKWLTSSNLARPHPRGQPEGRARRRTGTELIVQNRAEAYLRNRSRLQPCEILDSFRGGADDFGPAKIRTSFMTVPAYLEDA
jgi:hypothetical protein